MNPTKRRKQRRQRQRQRLFVQYDGTCQLCFGELAFTSFALIRKVKGKDGGKQQTNILIAHIECAHAANDAEQKKKDQPQHSVIRFGRKDQ